MLQLMAFGSGVKLALCVVAVVTAQPSPSCDAPRICRGIEAVGEADANKITDDKPIVKVIPYKYLDSEACRSQRGRPRSEHRLPTGIIALIALVPSLVVADPMDLDQRRGHTALGLLQKAKEVTISSLGGIKVRINEHDGIGAMQHKLKVLLVLNGRASQAN